MTNLPAGKEAKCYLSPIKALPIRKNIIQNPKLEINRQTVEFPVEIESGGYIEFKSMANSKLFGPDGSFIRDVKPVGVAPTLQKGDNKLSFNCNKNQDVSDRARVTISSVGEPIR